MLDPKLCNCSLTLYAFHSYRSNNAEQPDTDSNDFWKQLSEIGKVVQSTVLQNLRQELLTPERIDQQEYQILLKDSNDTLDLQLAPPINGFLTPYRIHNSYAADLTLGSSEALPLSHLDQLNPRKSLILSNLPGLYGQTLVLFAKPNGAVREYETLAKKCVEKIFQDPSIELVGQGSFLNGLVFEFDNCKFGLTNHYHALIWFSYHDLGNEQIERATAYLLLLLNARHTILYAYRQSRTCHQQAKQLYNKIETQLKKLHEDHQAVDRLKRFKEALIQLPQNATQYIEYLRNLSDQETTVATNIENFDQELSEFSKLSGTDAEFLKEFSALAKRRFLKQIQIDRKYLEPGQQMIQQYIDAIRGLTEIEQAEIDRKLGQIIQVVGVGLAAGSIVGSGSSYLERPFKSPFTTNTIHPFVLTLLVSFLAAFIAGGITFWIIRPKHRKWRWLQWFRSTKQ
ncbi:hypothetical protein [Leptolyngbya sp. GGD]|uniref:hypothetical protein n=1 Tax=Leptolyngbya sp. GGD TaxID=2997907 RepID=UPI00227BC6DF|nr:hypothetical protein [Leptolyngbya sp. GGD]MCY6493890.1 hypothetical protein [Leptolyngbya sp. GGD]